MARYRKVDTRIWNDLKYNHLSDDAKLVFVLLLTHQHLTPIGAMRATKSGLAAELHWNVEKFETCFSEIISLGMARYDEAASFLWLPNFLKYNRPESPNVVRSWDHLLDYLPECDLKNILIESISIHVATMSESFTDALPLVFRKTIPNQEQEQEQDHKQEQEKEIARGDASAISNFSLSQSKKYKFKNEFYDQAKEILEFLNIKADKAFEPTPENLNPIIRRLSSGESLLVCRQVIIKKTSQWCEVDKMLPNLNPDTLFGEKFSRYKGELVLPKEGACDEAR